MTSVLIMLIFRRNQKKKILRPFCLAHAPVCLHFRLFRHSRNDVTGAFSKGYYPFESACFFQQGGYYASSLWVFTESYPEKCGHAGRKCIFQQVDFLRGRCALSSPAAPNNLRSYTLIFDENKGVRAQQRDHWCY